MKEAIPPVYTLDLTQLSTISDQQLDNWIEQYSFAHNLHALKILSAKAKNNPDFTKILNAEILYIPDRSHLKKLIENLEPAILSEPLVSAIQEIQIPLDTEKTNEIIVTLSPAPEPEIETQEDEIKSDNLIISDIDKTGEESISLQQKEESKEVILTKKNRGRQVELNITENITPDPEPIESLEPDITEDYMQDKATSQINKIVDIDADNEDFELSDFSKWLKNKNITPTIETLTLDADSPPVKSQNEWEGIQEKILASYNTGALNKSEKPKKEQGDKKKKKLKPKVDETEVVTESYALLLEQQGKINKAIKIYEKLSLIIPEKTTYFADKIEHLKNK